MAKEDYYLGLSNDEKRVYIEAQRAQLEVLRKWFRDETKDALADLNDEARDLKSEL